MHYYFVFLRRKIYPMAIAKKLTVVFLFIFSVTAVQAQKFNHAVGAGFTLMVHEIAATNSYDGSIVKNIFRGGVEYFPRYNFVEAGKTSFSVGAPVSFGVGLVNTSIDRGFMLAGDASLGVYFNQGHMATRKTSSRFGFFVGGGFSGGFANIFLESVSPKIKSYGPMLHAGFRFPFTDDNAQIGLFYRHGLEADKFSTFGLKLGVDLE